MDGFKSAAQAYFNDENFSDLTIVCAATGKTYKSHRFLLSVHSKWFERCCKGAFAESGNRKIALKGDVPVAVDRMIEFFYKFDYSSDIPKAEETTQEVKTDPEEEFATQNIETELELHAWMYAIADKYEISDLKKLALAKFRADLRTQKRTRAEFELAITLIYSVLPLPESDFTLRQEVVDEWILIVTAAPDGIGRSDVAALSRKLPSFAADVQHRFLSSTSSTLFECASCKREQVSCYRDGKNNLFSCPRCGTNQRYLSAKLTSTLRTRQD
ncbi:hypothetical protein HII31_10515 [Pseudocercospora fuligena]|uniref:BTB domain-containing protein n=1 Tax=Pseudocercospora fuligena TaxID=685502 RepID=A0A8H6VEC8_9PEZI|nr:hypothetical protein HII31_10515 [Pseudocercospora fuligena]